jgi:hypothetical protein
MQLAHPLKFGRIWERILEHILKLHMPTIWQLLLSIQNTTFNNVFPFFINKHPMVQKK